MSTRASATSDATMRSAKRRERRPSEVPLPASWSTEATSVRTVRTAGAKLKKTLESRATPAVKATTVGSMPISVHPREAVGQHASEERSAPQATPRPGQAAAGPRGRAPPGGSDG